MGSRYDDERWKRELKENLKRASEELARGIALSASEAVARSMERAAEREQRRQLNRAQRRALRHQERLELRRQRREAKLRETTPTEGWALALVALVLLGFAAANAATLWWLVFVALPFALRSAAILGFHRARQPPPLPDAKAQAEALFDLDPRARRIDETCGKLQAVLKDAPESVRAFLSNPEETVESLRTTARDLLRRELALRELLRPDEELRLDQERMALSARIAAERDQVARSRLEQALAALDKQRAQRAELLTSANRLEAERTRLGYTLEGLYAQVVRMRTADAGSAELVGAGLRQSLEQLNTEVGALADALEQVNRVQPAIEPDLSLGPDDGAPGGGRRRVRE